VARSAQHRARPIRRRVGNEPRVPEPPREREERDLGLEPCQWRAEAVMDPTAVPEVLVLPAARNEALGVVELLRVAVPRSQ
jgi:hypothetical protein